MVLNQIQNYGQAAVDFTTDKLADGYDWVGDHKAETAGGLLVLDITTNAGHFTGQTVDAFFSNDGVREGSLRVGMHEFGEILEESNDVLFNWTDMLWEGAEASLGAVGKTEDGNLAYAIVDGTEVIPEMLTDPGEVAENVYEGEGLRGDDGEYYENMNKAAEWLFGEGGSEDPSQYTTTEQPDTVTPDGGQDPTTVEQTPDGNGGQQPETTAEPQPTETATPETPDFSYQESFDAETQDAVNEFFETISEETIEADELDTTYEEGTYKLWVNGDSGTYAVDLGENMGVGGSEAETIGRARSEGKIGELFSGSEYVEGN